MYKENIAVTWRIQFFYISADCFKYVWLTDKKRIWSDAQKACGNQLGGTLTNIHSEEEWQFVKGCKSIKHLFLRENRISSYFYAFSVRKRLLVLHN